MPRAWARSRPYLLPILVLLCLMLPHLNQGDWQADTALYSAIGLKAWRTHSLWTLYAAPGEMYTNKPPLALWIHGLFLYLLGPNLWAARLPTILAACGCATATVGIARQFTGRWSALWSGLVLSLTYDFFHRAGGVSLDMWQLLFLLLAGWCAVVGVRQARPLPIVLSGVPLGLALLCKPLMALGLLPLLALWILVSARSGRPQRWAADAAAGCSPRFVALLAAALVAIGVAAPWHISMAVLHGDAFLSQFFGREVVARASGELLGGQKEHKPILFYLVLMLKDYWPWMIPLLAGVVASVSHRARVRDPRLALLGIIWAAGWLIMLSAFPDRRDRYSLPIFPGLAWVAGPALATMSRRAPPFFGWAARGLGQWLPFAAPIAGLTIALLPIQIQSPSSLQWPALQTWLQSTPNPPPLWSAQAGQIPSAIVYLRTGAWPPLAIPGRAEPPQDVALLYHTRGDLRPGPDEPILFRAGDITVTRPPPGLWRPLPSGN